MQGRIAAVVLMGAFTAAAWGAPHLPEDDRAVLERLPTKPNDPAMVEVRRLRAALAASPNDSGGAARLAQRYFELASGEGDPRYVGYAEGVLRPWTGDDAPSDILFVRGLLRQYRHDFAGSLQDLDRVLRRDPAHVGARSWRAAIFMVRADYAAAARECAALAEYASELFAAGCKAYMDATTGHTRAAYERLSQVLKRHPETSAEGRLWTLTRLAEMAWRLEDHTAADRLFNEALALGIEDNFLLAAYADYLLERGRSKEVVGLLKSKARSDTLLLRLALAEQALGMREAGPHVQALADRFAAAALRGERLHMGEESRFLLELKGDARLALAVALENWKEQHEPRDAAAVLEAAIAARDSKAAEPVLRWLRDSGFESGKLKRLAASLQ
jgi:hypothetical protein